MNHQNQSNSELQVFKRFIAATEGLIDPASVKNASPPAPDIECGFGNSEDVAFELVELLESGFKRTLEFSRSNIEACFRHLQSLPESERSAFRALYADADILINFQDSVSKGQVQKAISSIFKELLAQPAGFDDLIDAFNDPSLKKTVLSISIQRGESSGPLFNAEGVGWVEDPCVERLEAKLKKTYITNRPIELLAYIDENPMYPDDIWMPQVKAFLAGLPSLSPFRQIWIFDLNTNTVVMRWP